ncbi:large neutral amino acids transporter small subunit 1-like, partial [Pogonomyrmex barbatus]|uniref:Large neutral amino acids transporter small subunit 1-like n=1 Tax=Pogonomyrmex barbatus TaxID=144034 RepID=A0A6I9VQH8_9HYME
NAFDFLRFNFNTIEFNLQLSIGVSVLCLPWLRWSQPDLSRPIKVNLIFPIFYILATLFVTIVPMYASPVETGYGCLMILSSIPVYLVFIAWKNKPKFFQEGVGAVTQTLQKLLVVVGPQKAKV